VRTQNVSLKYGQYGCGPYYDIKMIIKSLVTCKPSHSPIFNKLDPIHIYLFPYINIDESNEFRLFIHNNKLTALCQQHFIVNTNSQDMLRYISTKILNYFESINNYTMDVAYINDEIYFIELNTFGKEYATGSALFNWVDDEKILYGMTSNIIFRYLK
jgi:hypothetical protein